MGTLTFNIRFLSVGLKVQWADRPDEVPPWDWTRGFDEWEEWQEATQTNDWGKAKATPTGLRYPRLVRSDWRYINTFAFEGKVYRELFRLWPLSREGNWDKPSSRFRAAVRELVGRVGLLRDRAEEETLEAWRFAVAATHHLHELLRQLAATPGEPVNPEFWQMLREDWKVPANKHHCKGHLERNLWMLLSDLCSAVHSPKDPYPELEDLYEHLNLAVTPEGLPGNLHHMPNRAVVTCLEARRRIAAGYLLGTMQMSDRVTFSASRQVDVNVGAWSKAKLELVDLFSGEESRLCPRCGSPINPPQRQYCSRRCGETVRKRRKRAKRVPGDLTHNLPTITPETS